LNTAVGASKVIVKPVVGRPTVTVLKVAAYTELKLAVRRVPAALELVPHEPCTYVVKSPFWKGAAFAALPSARGSARTNNNVRQKRGRSRPNLKERDGIVAFFMGDLLRH
jgi:hypothetical protein